MLASKAVPELMLWRAIVSKIIAGLTLAGVAKCKYFVQSGCPKGFGYGQDEHEVS
jgi:hypothetical protein